MRDERDGQAPRTPTSERGASARPRRGNGIRRQRRPRANGAGAAPTPSARSSTGEDSARPPPPAERGGRERGRRRTSRAAARAAEPRTRTGSSLADDRLRPASTTWTRSRRPTTGRPGPRDPREGRNLAREARRRAAASTDDAVSQQPRATASPVPDEDGLRVGARAPAAEERRRQARLGGRSTACAACSTTAASALRGAGDRVAPSCASASPSRAPGDGGRRRRQPSPAAAQADRLPPPPQAPKPGPAQEAAPRRSSSSASALLAMVSTVFGMMMAVASDLPEPREPRTQYAEAQNSEVFDCRGTQDRDAAEQQPAHPGRVRGHLALHEAGRGRDRGPALLRAPRRRLPGHRPRRASRT